ncbi:MAG: cytochrome-c peroxidase [Thioploca sp.]|nr:cytochrome-c peroxidase [Thioploca sp.]
MYYLQTISFTAIVLLFTQQVKSADSHQEFNELSSTLAQVQSIVEANREQFRVTKTDFYPRDEAKENLGKLLFFDKILSGNRNISCATCHHPLTATGDGLSLSVGEGGSGLGVTRNTGKNRRIIHERVPRNAPHLFNLGAKEFVSLFDDGRAAVDFNQSSGFNTPAGDTLPNGLDNVLAAQAMFPVTSATEMAGQSEENNIAKASAEGNLTKVWLQLARRLQNIPEYVELFKQVFPTIKTPKDITYVHAANAIAAFEAAAWQCTNSTFDRLMQGEFNVVSLEVLRGMILFYTDAGCGDCHSGKFQTDHQFHAIAVPQIGPGKGDNLPGYFDGHDDFGRERVTKNPADRFKFRTPSLRQVAFTGPWGHDGAYNSLEQMIRHHLNPIQALNHYDTSQAILPSREDLDIIDFTVHNDVTRRQAIANANELQTNYLTDEQIANLIAFLQALTDFNCVDLRRNVPDHVPSGLSLVE